MNRKTMKNAVVLVASALGVTGLVAITTASPSWAVPVASNIAAVGTVASTQVTDVYYRRGYHGRGYYGRGYGRGFYGRGYGRGYYRRGYAYPYRGYAYPYANPYPYGYRYGW